MKMERVVVVLAALALAGGCAHTERSTSQASGGPAQPAKEIKAVGDGAALAFDFGGGVKLELALVPAGKFQMGSPASEKDRDEGEGPQHEVTISRPFHIGKCEVTQAQYAAVMGRNPSSQQDGPGAARRPVEGVSWHDAQEFCQKLSQRTGRAVRLPTEAEWEYACRAGTATPFHTGETLSAAQANYDARATYGAGAQGEYRRKTLPAGSLAPNAWGLCDMHGNVWEWCQDRYGPYPSAAVSDPAGATDCDMRLMRGGCWLSTPRYCRSAFRIGDSPDVRGNYLGFRVVVEAR